MHISPDDLKRVFTSANRVSMKNTEIIKSLKTLKNTKKNRNKIFNLINNDKNYQNFVTRGNVHNYFVEIKKDNIENKSTQNKFYISILFAMYCYLLLFNNEYETFKNSIIKNSKCLKFKNEISTIILGELKYISNNRFFSSVIFVYYNSFINFISPQGKSNLTTRFIFMFLCVLPILLITFAMAVYDFFISSLIKLNLADFEIIQIVYYFFIYTGLLIIFTILIKKEKKQLIFPIKFSSLTATLTISFAISYALKKYYLLYIKQSEDFLLFDIYTLFIFLFHLLIYKYINYLIKIFNLFLYFFFLNILFYMLGLFSLIIKILSFFGIPYKLVRPSEFLNDSVNFLQLSEGIFKSIFKICFFLAVFYLYVLLIKIVFGFLKPLLNFTLSISAKNIENILNFILNLFDKKYEYKEVDLKFSFKSAFIIIYLIILVYFLSYSPKAFENLYYNRYLVKNDGYCMNFSNDIYFIKDSGRIKIDKHYINFENEAKKNTILYRYLKNNDIKDRFFYYECTEKKYN